MVTYTNYTGEKLGVWVSENYIALARVYKWFYSFVEHVAPDTQYVEPTTKLNSWTSLVCKKWLGARGLDKSGNATDVKVRTKKYYRQKPKPPVIGPIGGSVKNIVNVVISLHAMISHIMCKNINAEFVDAITHHIKFFLTYSHMSLPCPNLLKRIYMINIFKNSLH